jgi:medium-chain acyl-[acyl-carrier-protein] hydrolase
VTQNVNLSPWLVSWHQRPHSKIRLFCFPFAGGGASVYRLWAQDIPENWELHSVQLPGRENRIGDTPYTCMDQLVPQLVDELLKHLDRPFVFFGHSMGAAIAFEVARRLQEVYGLIPEHLFVSGRSAPHRPLQKSPIYNLPRDTFIKRLEDLGGTPREVLEHPELMELLIPMLRADFELDDTYRMLPGPQLACPMSVYGGDEDPEVSTTDLAAWNDLSTAPAAVTYMQGGHFFIVQQRRALLEEIRVTLSGSKKYIVGLSVDA